MPETATITPPAPAVSPSPAPAASPEPTNSAFEAFDDVPEMGGEPAPAKPGPAAPAAAAPTKPAVAPPAQPQFDADKEKNIAKVREWGRGFEKQVKELLPLKEKLTSAEKKMAELEAKIPRSQQESETLNARIAEQQKVIDQYENKVRFFDYQESKEYREKYEQPYQAAYARGRTKIRQLMANVPTGEKDIDDRPVMTERPGTDADFDAIYEAPLGQAWKLARERFGDAAPTVMDWREKAAEHAENAIGAINKYRTEAAEIKKADAARRVETNSSVMASWRKANDMFSNDPKRQAYWGRDADDPEANAALDKGFAFADKRFDGEIYNALPMSEKVMLDAGIRHRVAGFYKLSHVNSKLSAENADLKKQLAEIRGSAPGDPKPVPAGGEPQGEDDGTMSAFDKNKSL